MARTKSQRRIIEAMRRTDLQDTSLGARREQIRRIRAMTPKERLRKTDAMIVEMVALRRRLDAARGRAA